MKRCLALIVAYTFLLASVSWAVEEIRQLGMNSATGGTGGDLRFGNTCTTSDEGKYYCGINSRHISFFSDNAITFDLLYPLAAGDTGFPYVSGGTWTVDSLSTYRGRLGTGTQDNTTFLRGDGTWSVPPGTEDAGDMDKATYDSGDDGQVDSAIATAITDGLIVNADINASADIAGSKILDNSVPVAKIQCSGTKDGTTYLRMDGTCAEVSATPGGDNNSLQYNNDGAFGGVANSSYDNAAETLSLPAVITPSVTATQTASPGCVKLWEGSGGGGEASGFCAPETLADNVYYTLPAADGNSGDSLTTNGAGVLSWTPPGTATAIPQAASPTVDDAGEVAIDTTADQLLYYGGALRVLAYQYTKDFVVKGATASDNTLLFKADTNITLTQLDCVIDPGDANGTDNVTVTLLECNSAGDTCVSSGASVVATNAGASDSTITDASIDANDWVKVEFSSVQGTASFLSCSIRYVITRQ